MSKRVIITQGEPRGPWQAVRAPSPRPIQLRWWQWLTVGFALLVEVLRVVG